MSESPPNITPDEKIEKVKVSGTGWLLAWDGQQWVAMFKLTDEQARIWREWVTS